MASNRFLVLIYLFWILTAFIILFKVFVIMAMPKDTPMYKFPELINLWVLPCVQKGSSQMCLSWVVWMDPKCSRMNPYTRDTGRTETDAQEVKWTQRQRLAWCGQQPRNAHSCWKRQWIDSPLESPEGVWTSWYINFGLLASKTVRE